MSADLKLAIDGAGLCCLLRGRWFIAGTYCFGSQLTIRLPKGPVLGALPRRVQFVFSSPRRLSWPILGASLFGELA